MTQRFEKAYNALYNAFMNDTLEKGSCVACAVGNIIANAMGGKISRDERNAIFCDTNNTFWGFLFYTSMGEQIKSYQNLPHDNHYIIYLKNLTGYSIDEMAEIEFAFETNTKIHFQTYSNIDEKIILEDQFNGLMAVMDVMIKLDEIKEGEQYKDSFKNKFNKETNLI